MSLVRAHLVCGAVNWFAALSFTLLDCEFVCCVHWTVNLFAAFTGL
jgi:hypothetical protein